MRLTWRLTVPAAAVAGRPAPARCSTSHACCTRFDSLCGLRAIRSRSLATWRSFGCLWPICWIGSSSSGANFRRTSSISREALPSSFDLVVRCTRNASTSPAAPRPRRASIHVYAAVGWAKEGDGPDDRGTLPRRGRRNCPKANKCPAPFDASGRVALSSGSTIANPPDRRRDPAARRSRALCSSVRF